MSTQTDGGIDYKLALELKNAGFPQNIKEAHYHEDCEDCMEGNTEQFENGHLIFSSDIKIPTLSELIEACDKLYIL